MNKNQKSEYGVINEQGFVAGKGLGFNTFNEDEFNPSQNKNNNNDASSEGNK